MGNDRLRKWVTTLTLLVVVASTIGCDQVSKHIASTRLIDSPARSYLGDSVRLQYAENTGGFLSLGAGLPSWARTAVFSIGTAVLLIVYVVAAFKRPFGHPALLGLCLLFAGGASNLVDRIIHGRVVDFLNVGIGPVRTGIFNVADVAVMLGVALFLLHRRAAHDGGKGSGSSTG
jgi:signal peptidase II